MRVTIPKGKYILAVSGGVDSMVLLDILRRQADIELIVAHFNHGIRDDSKKDEELVREVADKHGLEFEAGRARLGENVSEATAREARYKFLEKVRRKSGAKAIITAHHRDDLIETALLNTLRGTKRRGLTSLADNPKIIRLLLKYNKREILNYAKKHRLVWQEDSTNQDERYLRNYIRARLTDLPGAQLEVFAKKLERAKRINRQIDERVATISQLLLDKNRIERREFIQLPADVSREVVRYWLTRAGLAQADKKTIDKTATFIKTALPNSRMPLGKTLALRNTDRHSILWKARAR